MGGSGSGHGLRRMIENECEDEMGWMMRDRDRDRDARR